MANAKEPAAPASNDNGSEAADLAAAGKALEAEGALTGNHDEDFASLERARRQRDPDAYKAEVRERNDLVTVKVTEEGDGKISRGVHHGGIGEDHYEEGESFTVERRTALELKKRHYVELPK